MLKACNCAALGDYESTDLLRTLVEMGLDPAAGDYDGRTPAHLAACNGKLALLEFLVQEAKKSNIDRSSINLVNAVDRHGYTPLDDAHRHRNAASALVLEHAGGLRKGDPLLDSQLQSTTEARQRKLREIRRDIVLNQLSDSQETKAWKFCEENTLPQLTDFMSDLSKKQEALIERVCGVLTDLSLHLENQIARYSGSSSQAIQTNNFLTGGYSMNPVQGSSAQLVSKDRSNPADISFAVREALDSLDDFFSTDFLLARDSISVDLTTCRFVQATSSALAASVQVLMVQIRHNGNILRFLKKLLRGVRTCRITINMTPVPPTLKSVEENRIQFSPQEQHAENTGSHLVPEDSVESNGGGNKILDAGIDHAKDQRSCCYVRQTA